MANVFIGSATGTTSGTLPAHQTNDLIVGFAFRDGSTTLPTVPSGQNWTTEDSGAANANCLVLVSKIAASSGETTGTFTNATSVVFHVYRGNDLTTPIGAKAQGVSTNTSHTFPALTMQVTDGTSWVGAFIGSRAIGSAIETPPTGMTNRSTVLDGVDEAAGHDTNGGVSSWSSVGITQGGTTTGSRSVVYEIRAAATAISGTASDTLAMTGAATANVLATGIASGDFSANGAATGATLVSGVASATFDISGSSSTSQDVAGIAAGDFDITGGGDGSVQALVRIVRGDDGDDHRWQRIFYKDLDEALDEILEADDAQEVAQAVAVEFAPFVASLPDPTPIAEALEQLRHVALKRRDVAKRVEIVRAEIERARLRKKRNNEAALMLLMQ